MFKTIEISFKDICEEAKSHYPDLEPMEQLKRFIGFQGLIYKNTTGDRHDTASIKMMAAKFLYNIFYENRN